MQTKSLMRMSGFAILVLLMSSAPAMAQSDKNTGNVKIHVSPKQAYVFVDGNAIRDGSQTIALSPGKHSVASLQLRIRARDANRRCCCRANDWLKRRASGDG